MSRPATTSQSAAFPALSNSSAARALLASTRFLSGGSASARSSALASLRYWEPIGSAWRLFARACSMVLAYVTRAWFSAPSASPSAGWLLAASAISCEAEEMESV